MKRILVVDDEQAILDILKEFLEGQGQEVFIAKNTTDAINSFLENDIDLVISDYVIDEKNGLELSQEMLFFNKDLPIIIMSGNVDFETEKKLLKEGVRYVVKKPFNLSRLRGFIKLCFLPDP
ncbi:response regulator [bacterium]|nr:response regulator [bacterium]